MNIDSSLACCLEIGKFLFYNSCSQTFELQGFPLPKVILDWSYDLPSGISAEKMTKSFQALVFLMYCEKILT